MPTVDNLDIQISTSLKNTDKMLDNLIAKLGIVSSSLSRVGGTTSNVSNGMTRVATSSTKATKSFKGLASAFGRFYANYFLVVRGIKSLYNSIKGTADYIEAFNYFEVSFNKIAREWKQDYEKFGYENAEEYAKSFSERAKESLSKLSGVQIDIDADGKGLLTETGMKNLGLNIQEITQYASQLASVTNSVGQTGEVSLAAANSFAKLAGDISSLFNVDYSSVAKNLQSGLIGQSRALYKYGIDITNATLQTYAYKLGLSKAVSEMTQAEKMQLRMIAILEQSKVSWGDLANTINSPSNMLRQFKNNLKEAGMMLGQLFVPILAKVLPFINGVTIALKRLLGNIAGFLGIKLDLSSFGQGASDLSDSYGDLSDELDNVASSAKKAKAGLRGFDELKTINMPDSSGAGGIGGAIDLTDEIIKATQEYEKVWKEAYDKMEQRAEAFADKVEKALEPVKKLFKDIAIGDWFSVGKDVSNIVSGIFDFFSKAIESVDWEQVGKNIGLFLAGLDWKQILTSAFNLISNLQDAFVEVFKSSFKEAPIETTIVAIIATWKWVGLGPALMNSMKNSIVMSLGGSSGGGLASVIANNFRAILKNPTSIISLIGTPAFDATAGQFVWEIIDAFDRQFPKLSDFLGKTISGISLGGLAGSWIPGIGTLVGAVIGGIIGGFDGITINGKSILKHIMDGIFNFDLTTSLIDSSNKFFENVKTSFENKDWLGIGKNIVLGIGNGITGALMLLFEPVFDLFEIIGEFICDIFGIHSPATEMEYYGENILLGIIEGFKAKFEDMRQAVKDFFDNVVAPMFSAKEWSKKITSIKDVLKEKWDSAKTWWDNNVKLPKLDLDFKFSTESINESINGVIGLINKYIIDNLNKISIKIPEIKIFGETLYKGTTIGFDIKRISTFETGGFPERASLFWANENGIPELVGTMGGRTAVASGMEITGIKEAIYSTGQQESSLMETMVGLLRIIAEKDYGITDDQIGKSAQRYARSYFNRTGNEAYSF